jgi:hypothetical protein
MKTQHWLAVAAVAGLALTGCSNLRSADSAAPDTEQSSSSSSGTMRRAESGSNTSPNPATRNSDCLPGDTRQNCPPDNAGSRTNSQSSTPDAAPEVETPESSEPVPR